MDAAGGAGAVIRAHFDATNRRDWDAVMAAFADEVVLVVPSWSLMTGTYRGRDRVGRWFGDWMRTFRAHIDFKIRDLHENGDDVAVWAHHTARGEQSGLELEMDLFYHYRVREGRIVFVALCDSWDDAVAAATPKSARR